MGREWTPEQREAAAERMRERNAAKKTQETRERVRVPVGANRDITAVRDTPDGFVDRWVNDDGNRIEKFKQAGYEFVESANVGDSRVDGKAATSGIVSKDMGKGVTAYLMRQRRDWYNEDQSEKHALVDRTEETIRREKRDSRNPDATGHYGEVTIGRK